ncbi:hypothetical protein BSL78_00668 [Apostichopus japonicus]|uniref:DUF547 domain-containing protein n=1 Tax=Stichopus japonicus TaxID=307972 RepID=A0A2G8LQA2_STIJA|nr:hypothetical protein BSL78_00668 [Apostichopus japonicus]
MNILNQHLPCPGLEVSRELQQLMLRMKGEFMLEDGHSVDYHRLKEGDLFKSYEMKAVDLQHVDLTSLKENERKAFFINIYNALTIHGLAKCPTLPRSVLDVEKFWRSTGYIISGDEYSLDDIEHGVLRGNRPHPSSPELFFKDGDSRLQYVMSSLDPRVHFALVCGAKSCPPISVYSGTNIDSALDAATKSYLGSEMTVDDEKEVISLPKLLQWYRTDFGQTSHEVVRWTLPFLDEAKKKKIEEILNKSDSSEIAVSYNEYNWHLNSVE